MFFTNLCLSPNNGELETLVLCTRIILNYFLFEKVFDIKFSGVIHFMNGSWLGNFEVSFDEAKKVVSDLDTNNLTFGPLSLSFCNRILAHIVATTLIPRKGTLMVEVSTTYDSKTFTSMGCILVEKEYCKNESVKSRPDTSRESKPVPKYMSYADKEPEEIKIRLTPIEEGIDKIKESTTKLLQ
ncbi:hypothetical protein FXO38_34070 [Capsicum annuum]|nr:hypothetical protein FXO37_36130 [Capsicum annuum]KAF3617298.1 hypothetical protein FXO38_34070 [Capsicum annuum]